MCAGRPQQSVIPRWGFYGEIKESHGGYLQLHWHSKSEDGVDCSSIIEDTFERLLPRCLPNTAVNHGAIGTSSGRFSHGTEWTTFLVSIKCQKWWRTHTFDWVEFPVEIKDRHTASFVLIAVKSLNAEHDCEVRGGREFDVWPMQPFMFKFISCFFFFITWNLNENMQCKQVFVVFFFVFSF